jgi:hypothetical protein
MQSSQMRLTDDSQMDSILTIEVPAFFFDQGLCTNAPTLTLLGSKSAVELRAPLASCL